MKQFNKGDSAVELLIIVAFVLIFFAAVAEGLAESSDSSDAVGTLEGEEIIQTYQPLPETTSSQSAVDKPSSVQNGSENNTVILQDNGSQVIRTHDGDTSTEIIQENGKQVLKITEGGKTTTIIQDENGTRTTVE